MSGNLKVHQRTHIGEQPIKCDKCKKSSNQLGDLKVHLCTLTGEQEFTCGVRKEIFEAVVL